MPINDEFEKEIEIMEHKKIEKNGHSVRENLIF